MFTSIAISWAVFQCRLNQSIKQWDSMYKQKIWEYLQFMTLARGKKEFEKNAKISVHLYKNKKYWKNQQYCIGRRKKWARYSNKTFRSPILQDFMIEKQKNSSTQCTDEKNNLSIDNLDIFHVTRDVLLYLNNRVY